MTSRIVAMGASSSRNSINKRLAKYAAEQIEHATVNLLDLANYEMPLYSIDRENEEGIPELAYEFKSHLKAADGIIISFAEHNGAYAAVFKNVMDWISRMEGSTWENKPMLLMSTSPGPRGGTTVLEIAVNKFRFMNKNTLHHFSLPTFFKNFDDTNGIIDVNLKASFNEQLKGFAESIKTPAEV